MPMTDPKTAYERRDELRAANHDAVQSMLKIVQTVLAATNAARESAEARDAAREEREARREERHAAAAQRTEQKFDAIMAEIEQIKRENRRQDRIQTHDGAVAEEALAIAAAKTGRRSGAMWGTIAAAVVTALAAVAVEMLKWRQ